MSINFDLHGKVAVITGGAGILCSEMSIQLAKRGVKVAILDMNLEKIKQITEDINRDGGDSIGVQVDVLNKESLFNARNIVLDKYGRVDILINGAGGNKKEATVTEDNSFFDLPIEAVKWVSDLNYIGTVMPTQVFAEIMAKQESGSIINISSMASFVPMTRVMSYSAAKAAINNFTMWLAVYLNQNFSSNIRVNAIAPGFFLTDQNRYLLVDAETGEDTARGKLIKQHTPMGRYGNPDELIGAVIWLSSDAAAFVNGIILPIDGGFMAFAGV